MAIPGDDRDVILGDESPTTLSLLRGLKQRFPEIPPDIVSSLLQKNHGNMSRCEDELEQLSSAYMYGRVGPRDSAFVGSSTPNPSAGRHRSSADLSSHQHTPEWRTHPPNSDFHRSLDYHWPEPPPETGAAQTEFTSWVSMDTGVPDLDPPHARRDRTLAQGAGEPQRHVSSCTVDMLRKRTESGATGTGHAMSGAGNMPRPEEEDLVAQRPGDGFYSRTLDNGLERGGLEPDEFPFEPRLAWREETHQLADPKLDRENLARRNLPSRPIKPAEVQSPSQIATSYQLDHPKPSSPACTPQRASQGTTVSYVKSTDRICLKPDSTASTAAAAATEPAGRPSVAASVVDREEKTDQRTTPLRQDRAADNLRLPTTQLPERSLSKEKEDQEYTKALLTHQETRYEHLIKEMETEKRLLAQMRKETSQMEEEIAHKRHHRPPFPTPEEITKLREQIRQLQIDIECMSREIESYKSQGLMDLTQASSFYGNIAWTGAPGPVPPIPQPGNAVPEPAVEAPPPPAPSSYEEGQTWSCSSCTFLNHPALDKCEFCESPQI